MDKGPLDGDKSDGCNKNKTTEFERNVYGVGGGSGSYTFWWKSSCVRVSLSLSDSVFTSHKLKFYNKHCNKLFILCFGLCLCVCAGAASHQHRHVTLGQQICYTWHATQKKKRKENSLARLTCWKNSSGQTFVFGYQINSVLVLVPIGRPSLEPQMRYVRRVGLNDFLVQMFNVLIDF